MEFDRSKFLGKFIEECRENVGRLQSGLLALETNPDDSEVINTLFRVAHTIKGSSRMMSFTEISEVAHKVEDAFHAVRDGSMKTSGELISLLLRASDTIGDMLDRAESGAEVKGMAADMKDMLSSMLGQKAKSGDGEPRDISPRFEQNVTEKQTFLGKDGARSAAVNMIADPVTPNAPGYTTEEQNKSAADAHAGFVEKRIETIRIKTSRLDNVVNLVDEILGIFGKSRQRMTEIVRMERLLGKLAESLAVLDPDPEEMKRCAGVLADAHQEMKNVIVELRADSDYEDTLAKELHARALEMRMQPVSSTFATLKRHVRDYSATMKKDVRMITRGDDIEIDRKVIEKLVDPLMHMIRNSVGHGIEEPDEREKAGKPRTGTISITAEQEGDSAVIVISDDGRGLQLEQIRAKAVQRKIVTESAAAAMSEDELINLVYMPGFSTAEIITDVSGRGVGMDVVKKNIIEDLRGLITIKTEKGRGTSIYIKLPLSVTFSRVFIVRASGNVFAIPPTFVTEFAATGNSELIDVGDRKVLRLREKLIPAVKLADMLQIPGRGGGLLEGRLAMITCVGEENAAMMVDELIEEVDALIRPVPAHFKGNPWVSGGVAAGGSEVVSVLHIPALMNIVKETRSSPISSPRDAKKVIRILIVEDSVSTREIEKSILESCGFVVLVAGDGQEALEMLETETADLFVVDIEMPRMDGFTFTERLRADKRWRKLPVVLVSSRDTEEDKRRGIRAGANAYITKGVFEQSNLVETVKALLGE